MLTDEQRARIEALSNGELEHEIALGSASHFQREKHAYLKKVKALREQAEATNRQAASLSVAQQNVDAARDATQSATKGWKVNATIGLVGAVLTAAALCTSWLK